MAKENVAAIEIIKLKDFEASISSMWSMGAERKRRAEKIFSIIGRLNIGIKAFDGVPLPEVEDGPQEDDVKNLTGKQFIYSPFARGLSGDALLRIDELVDGVGLISDRKRVRWQTMGQLKEDLENQPSARAAFGPRVQMEIRGVLEKL